MVADTPIGFGVWLRRRRKALDLTQEELARQIGCSTITLRKLEAEERRPSQQMVTRLADLFEIPPAERPAFLRFARGDPWAGLPTHPGPALNPAPWQMSPLPSQAHLPAPLTRLIGREQEITALRHHLLNSNTRLLTLIGPPGIGKTRLGLHIVTELKAEHAFADGVFFIALAALNDPNLVASTVAQSLSLRETGGQPPLELLKDSLRNRQALLLLDNFEQILEAAPLILELLMDCSHLKVVVTSRAALRLYGEQRFPVPPLALPNLDRLPSVEMLATYPAVTLFVERAQAVQPDFKLTTEKGVAVAAICAHLDGLPLAIELVAARINLLSPSALLKRLVGDPSLRLRSDGLRGIPDRQRTLYQAIDWSYNLLSEEEQALFARLAVFVGGWTLEAAEAVCSDAEKSKIDQVFDGLASLVDKSLVVRQEQEGEIRFTMLELIREYALKRLAASGEAERLQRSHMAHYMAWVEEADSQLDTPEQAKWMKRYERDHDNLQAALTWLLEQREVEIAAQFIQKMAQFWTRHSHLSDGHRWLERLLAATRDTPLPALVQAKLLNHAGANAFVRADYPAMRSFHQEALTLALKLEDKEASSLALIFLGICVLNQGDDEEAKNLLEEGMTLAHSINHQILTGIAIVNLGNVARFQGDLTRADNLYHQGLALFRELDHKFFISTALGCLGLTSQDRGNYRQAAALHCECLILSHEVGAIRKVAWALENLAGVAGAQGQPEQAARLMGAAEGLRQATGTPVETIFRVDYEKFVAIARAGLDEATFATAWAEGRTMKLEQAVAYALEHAGE